MTLKQIDEILAGNFTDPEDRTYWEKKRAETINRMDAIAENEQYFTEMAIYDR